MSTLQKKCIICTKIFPIDQMTKRSCSKDGYGSYCKPCESKRTSEWGAKNKDRRRVIRRRYIEKHPRLQWAQSTRQNHKVKGHTIQISTHDLWKMAEGTDMCTICGCKLSWEKGKCNGSSPTMDRIDNGNIITKDNVAIICHRCNTTKGPRTMPEFVEYCKMVVKKMECRHGVVLEEKPE